MPDEVWEPRACPREDSFRHGGAIFCAITVGMISCNANAMEVSVGGLFEGLSDYCPDGSRRSRRSVRSVHGQKRTLSELNGFKKLKEAILLVVIEGCGNQNGRPVSHVCVCVHVAAMMLCMMINLEAREESVVVVL